LSYNENLRSKFDEKEEKIHLLENKIIGMEEKINKIYEQIQKPSEKLIAGDHFSALKVRNLDGAVYQAVSGRLLKLLLLL